MMRESRVRSHSCDPPAPHNKSIAEHLETPKLLARVNVSSAERHQHEHSPGRANLGAVPAGPAAPVAPQHVHADDHWPICRCGHPMHPNKIELRRGVRLERYECPRQRWWNKWWHPYIWQPPRH
jgi:hypothetical protein